MRYPETLTPKFESQRRGRIAPDPIAEARQQLHAAARLPYASARSREWGRSFGECVRAARQALRRHIARSSEEDSPVSPVERAEPRLHSAMERQRSEHHALALQLDALCDAAASDADVGLWRMVDLGERAMLLERALERHHERLVRLVYEMSNRELGGEGG
jgi:hypothetical protein